MPDRRRDREFERARLKGPPSGAATDSSAPALSRMPGDRLSAVGWAAWEQAGRSLPPSAPAAPRRPPRAARRHARAGALVALASPAETDDHSRQPTRRPRTASQRGVPRRQEDEMAHVSAGHAHRSAVVHDQQATVVVAALRTGPRPERRDNHQIRPAAWPPPRSMLVSIDHGWDASEMASRCSRVRDRTEIRREPCPQPCPELSNSDLR